MAEPHEEAQEATELKDRKIALLIAVLALLLAFAETGSKSTQTEVLATHVEASDLWAFYQAKTIRQTILTTAEEAIALEKSATPSTTTPGAIEEQLSAWRTAATKLESDPRADNGRKELAAQAQNAEKRRAAFLAGNRQYEIGAAGLQIAIVLASASIITEMAFLAVVGGGLGLVGAVLTGFAFFAPSALDFL